MEARCSASPENRADKMKLFFVKPKKYRLQEQPKLICLHNFPGKLRQRIGPKQRASAAPVIYT